MGYLGVSVCVLICSLLIKDKHRAFSFVLTACGVALIAIYAVSGLKEVFEKLMSLTESLNTSDYFKLMLKALALTLLTQAVSDICRDNGESALAGITETAAKSVIIVMLLPLFENVINIVSGLVK